MPPETTGAAGVTAAVATAPDTRSPQEKAQTAHLSTFNPPKQRDEDAAAEDGDVAVADYDLPDDPAELVELLQATDREPANTKTEQTVKDSKLNAIREKLHAVQQSHTQVPIAPEAFVSLAAAQSAHAKETRLAAIAREHPLVGEVLEELAGLRKTATDAPDGDVVTTLTDKLNALTESAAAMQTSLESQLQSANAAYSTLTTANADIQSKFEAVSSVNADLQSKLDAAAATNAGLVAEGAQLSAQLSALQGTDANQKLQAVIAAVNSSTSIKAAQSALAALTTVAPPEPTAPAETNPTQ